MMLSRRTFSLTALGLAVSATLAACSSKSKDEATEEGKMALIVSDAGEAAAEELSKAVEAFTKETKVEVDVKPVSDVSQELARGITAEPEDRSVLTWVRPATEPSEAAVAFVPSALVSPPPPWTRKAPTRA